MIGFESDEAILQKLWAQLRRMTDEELITFGKDVRRLAENPIAVNSDRPPKLHHQRMALVAVVSAEERLEFALTFHSKRIANLQFARDPV
jgi:hypothetical protein